MAGWQMAVSWRQAGVLMHGEAHAREAAELLRSRRILQTPGRPTAWNGVHPLWISYSLATWSCSWRRRILGFLFYTVYGRHTTLSAQRYRGASAHTVHITMLSDQRSPVSCHTGTVPRTADRTDRDPKYHKRSISSYMFMYVSSMEHSRD